MNIKKHAKNTAMAMVVAISASSTVFAANTYTDIPATHWAYTSITRVADKGIIVGDGTKYNPSEVINKFEASRILARVAGYSTADGYIPKDASLNYIQLFKNAFPLNWNTINKDQENCISYLYENKILDQQDLNKIVIRTEIGTERLNNLSREEMAILLVRTLGKVAEANAYSGSFKFSDDSTIPANSKASVYYLKYLGVVSGDTSNNFNPNKSITKAEMAIFLDRAVYSKTVVANPIVNNPVTVVDTNNTSNGTINVTTDIGKVNAVYTNSNVNVLSLMNTTNQIKAYKVTAGAKVYVDGAISTIDKLIANMPIFVTVINTEITEIKATSVTPVVTIPVVTTPVVNTPNTSVDVGTLETREYTVDSISTLNNNKVLSIAVQINKPSGDTYKEIKSYTLSGDCTIKKSDKTILFSDIKKDDTVTIKYSGNVVYSIVVDEANMSIKDAELVDKKLSSDNVPILTIKTSAGTLYELKVVNSSDIRKKGEGSVNWKDLRIGDVLEVDKSYNNISYLYAVGETSTEDGFVKKIVLSNDFSSITLSDKYGEVTEYRVSSPNELYAIKLNSKIRVSLESKEVGSIKVLSEADVNTTFKGTIDTLRYDYMYVNSDASGSTKVIFDKNTKVYDALLSKDVTIDDLDNSMYVTVIFTNLTDNVAQKINIVSK